VRIFRHICQVHWDISARSYRASLGDILGYPVRIFRHTLKVYLGYPRCYRASLGDILGYPFLASTDVKISTVIRDQYSIISEVQKVIINSNVEFGSTQLH